MEKEDDENFAESSVWTLSDNEPDLVYFYS